MKGRFVDILSISYKSNPKVFQECSDVLRNRAVGKHIYTPDFCKFIARIGNLWRARVDGRVVGVLSTGLLKTTDAFMFNVHLESKSRIDSLPHLEIIDLGVEPEFRRQHIGSLLVKTALAKTKWGDDSLFRRAVTLSRISKDGGASNSSLGLLRALGWEEIYRFPGYYEDSDPNYFQCPKCQVGEGTTSNCQCTAVLMRWRRPL